MGQGVNAVYTPPPTRPATLTGSSIVGGLALAALAQFVFQLLAKQSPGLESALSRWWRSTGRELPIVLVLAGSELSFFEDEVLAGRLPIGTRGVDTSAARPRPSPGRMRRLRERRGPDC